MPPLIHKFPSTGNTIPASFVLTGVYTIDLLNGHCVVSMERVVHVCIAAKQAAGGIPVISFSNIVELMGHHQISMGHGTSLIDSFMWVNFFSSLVFLPNEPTRHQIEVISHDIGQVQDAVNCLQTFTPIPINIY